MIGFVESDSKVDNPYDAGPSSHQQLAGSEVHQDGTEQLPPFGATRAGGSTAVQFLQEDADWVDDGGEGPPDFTPYEAEHWLGDNGDIWTHDPHLNEDGEALYRFLLSQATIPPRIAVRCRGTHTEIRTRIVTHTGGHHHHQNGSGNGLTITHNGSHTKTETYTETIVDFDFSIELSQHLMSPVNWTVSDDEPAYRGGNVRETEVQDGFTLNRHPTSRKQNKEAQKWREFKEKNGLPPWVQGNILGGPQRLPNDLVVRSSRTSRQWADEYCASDKLLKEFVFQKVIYGWNIEALQKSIETLIKSTYYSGKTEITFPVTGNTITIRPTNRLSRALSQFWIKVILWITLIYPFIWLFKRFSKTGGGEWRVAGAAYPFKDWVHLEDSVPGEDVAQYLMRKEESQSQTQSQRLLQTLPPYSAASSSPPRGGDGDAWADRRPSTLAQFGASTSSTHPPRTRVSAVPSMAKLRRTPKGISELVGLREGEWFKQWETTLTRSVLLRLERKDPMMLTSEVLAESAGAMLDGFRD